MSTYTYQQLTNSDKADVLRSKIKNNEYMLYDISASIEIEKASSDINEDLINQLEINLNNVTNTSIIHLTRHIMTGERICCCHFAPYAIHCTDTINFCHN